jgi:Uncharacterized conserved protein
VLFLQKLVSLFLSPLLQALLLWAVALVAFGYGRRRIAWGAGISGLLWLVVTAMPLTSRVLLQGLEKDYPPVPMAQVPEAQAIVLLGGCLSGAPDVLADMNLHESVDRVRQAARLFHAGKAPLVVISAGNLPWNDAVETEAAATARLLQEWGVPRSALVLEGRSRTTRENAVNAWQLLSPQGIRSVLLVTSAWHMRRAEAAFTHVGFSVIPSATDWAGLQQTTTIQDWLPQVDALSWTEAVFHEWVGYWVYRLRGWME